MTYCFYAKKEVDYSKYGLILSPNKKEWVLWDGTRRITIKTDSGAMSFNNVTNKVLKIFKDMINDNIVIVKEHKDKPRRNHYINVDDEEYELIQKRRNELCLN